MEKHVLIVMARRIQPEHIDVERVRDPGQRMPVRGIPVGKRPQRGAQRQAVLDVRVLGYVLGVIEVREGVTVHRPIKGEYSNGEQKTKQQSAHRRISQEQIVVGSNCRLRLNVDGSHVSPFFATSISALLRSRRANLPAGCGPLEQFQNWCSPAGTGRAALQLDYS